MLWASSCRQHTVEHTPLPAADRLFLVEHQQLPQRWLVGVKGQDAYIASIEGAVVLKLRGEGTVQAAAFGDIGAGPRVYLVWGRARGALHAPLVLLEVDPISLSSRELWRKASPRTEVAYLGVVDVDGDNTQDLAFVYFESKYFVRPHHFLYEARGGRYGVLLGAPMRMATSWAFADVDNDHMVDWIVGRPYGDTRDAVGDLRVRSLGVWKTIPTENGVRTVAVDPSDNSIWFADGWVKNYARAAHAQLKRARYSVENKEFQVESMGVSSDEYTFNDIVFLKTQAVDGAEFGVAAHGNKRWSVLGKSGLRPARWANASVLWERGQQLMGYDVGAKVRLRRLPTP